MQSSGTRSPAFERFRWSFFEDKDFWRDGLDSTALSQLEGEERRRAEDMLIGHLPDERGVIGLGELRSLRAEPQLSRLFDAERKAQRAAPSDADGSWSPYRLVHLAKALWQIRPKPQWLAGVIEVLASADLEDVQRLDAAMALSVFRDPAAVRALVERLDDPESLIRHHAARALLVLHGLVDEAEVIQQPQHMIFRVMSDDAARRETAKGEILAAVSARTMPGA
jgi:HEAT repeat protein